MLSLFEENGLKQSNLDDNSVTCAIGPHVNRIFMIELNCEKMKIKNCNDPNPLKIQHLPHLRSTKLQNHSKKSHSSRALQQYKKLATIP